MPTVGSGTWPDAIDVTPLDDPNYVALAEDLSGNGNHGILVNTDYSAFLN